jgi:very-short-patch-repair endonuclease
VTEEGPHSPSPLVGEGLGRGGLRDYARTLRKNQTEAERNLWKLLRAKRLDNWKFRRQYPIGSYIVDFAFPSARLIVEADGSQHAENAYDVRRDAWLASQGWRVIRFWNHHILNDTETVLTAVFDALSGPLPHPPTPLPQGERG